MSIDYNKIEVQIELDNLRHNYKLFKELSPNVIPVIKSDAYGHGLVEVARALDLEEPGTIAVGYVNEASLLRRSGCDKRIMALLGPVDEGDYTALWEDDILAAIAHWGQLERMAALTRERGPMKIALKVDTGMRRLGFLPEELGKVVDFLRANPGIEPVMVSSHLASADEPQLRGDVELQAERFRIAVETLRQAGFAVEANIANSAAALGHDPCRLDSVRLGISLYGANPFHGSEWQSVGERLKPAMHVSAPVLQVHPLKKGEGISYGWTHVAERDCMVAIVGAGYADCYSRGLSGRGEMNIGGARVPILGRVCMQMTAVDVTALMGQGGNGDSVKPGDRAWLLGGPAPGAITPAELAGWWDTITYEVFCLLGMNPRTYI